MRTWFRTLLLVPLLVGLLATFATACGDDDGTSAESAASPESDGTGELSGGINVLAAASLTDSFTEIGKAFEAEHPGTKVTFSFAASSALAQQINEGAPADVFASADQANMQKVVDESNVVGEPEVFATNELQIITESGNPHGIASLADLAHPDLIVVTCSDEVPIGRYAQEALDKAGVDVTPKSYEADVKAVVNKVTSGEADAGIVYATDVKAAGDKATAIEIPDDHNVIATYPIAVIKEARNAAVAEAFVDYVLSPEGQKVLSEAGFTSP